MYDKMYREINQNMFSTHVRHITLIGGSSQIEQIQFATFTQGGGHGSATHLSVIRHDFCGNNSPNNLAGPQSVSE